VADSDRGIVLIMVAAVVDLIEQKAIEQGCLWDAKISYPGNVTGARFKGQIKRDYQSKVIAEFRFGLGIFDAETNKTKFAWFLPSAITKTLPIPNPDEHFVYDVVFYGVNVTEPIRVLRGIVHVSPGATET
jgi:hypothetical protein